MRKVRRSKAYYEKMKRIDELIKKNDAVLRREGILK